MRDDASLVEVLTFFLQENADRLTLAQMELATVFMLGEMKGPLLHDQFESVGIRVMLRIARRVHWHVEFK